MNYVFLRGEIATLPTLTVKQNERTQVCVFSLKTIERWRDPDGKPCNRTDFFKIEVLGRNAQKAVNLRPGDTALIVGYLRTIPGANGRPSETRVRAFSVLENQNDDVLEGYHKALTQVLAVLEHSDNLEQARAKVRILKEEFHD